MMPFGVFTKIREIIKRPHVFKSWFICYLQQRIERLTLEKKVVIFFVYFEFGGDGDFLS